MNGHRLAVYTTVYPGVEKYLRQWHDSVVAQSDRDFDLWISVDSLSVGQVISAIGTEPHASWLPAAPHATPAQIRNNAISHLVNRYAAIVFVDSDDLLYPSRVEAARKGLQNFDVVGCALSIMTEDGKDLGIVFGPRPGQHLDELLPRYNVFGLSNTAYRSQILKHCLPIVPECVLIDWLLATKAWIMGARLWFDSTPRMVYRQYGHNTARVTLPFKADDVLLATGRVLDHYRYVLGFKDSSTSVHRDAIEASRVRVDRFNKVIQRSASTLDAYVKALNQLPPQYVWWWSVAHPDLEFLWKN